MKVVSRSCHEREIILMEETLVVRRKTNIKGRQAAEMRDASKRVCYVMMAIFIKPFCQGKEKEIFDSHWTT